MKFPKFQITSRKYLANLNCIRHVADIYVLYQGHDLILSRGQACRLLCGCLNWILDVWINFFYLFILQCLLFLCPWRLRIEWNITPLPVDNDLLGYIVEVRFSTSEKLACLPAELLEEVL